MKEPKAEAWKSKLNVISNVVRVRHLFRLKGIQRKRPEETKAKLTGKTKLTVNICIPEHDARRTET